jgi:hypothetical protein
MVFDASRYLTLNNYGYSPESIAMVKEYLRTRVLPESLDNSAKKKRFLAKWQTDFKIENNKLVYVPLNLTVVPNDERNDILLKIYKDLKTGVGQGISMFYNRVRDKYLNIRRKDVGDFLKSHQHLLFERLKCKRIAIAKKPHVSAFINCICFSLKPNRDFGILLQNVVISVGQITPNESQ